MEQKIRKGQSEGPVGADADPRRAWPGRQKEMHPVAVLTGNEHYLAWVQQVAGATRVVDRRTRQHAHRAECLLN